MRNFVNMLKVLWARGLFVCVGLDIEPGAIPEDLGHGFKSLVAYSRQMYFLTGIVKATRDIVCAYKPNLAFYLQQGSEGIRLLGDICEMIRREAPEVPIILDGKFGDVDHTNKAYAKFADIADAVTVSPFVGLGAFEPFVGSPDRGVIFLCHTSNKGAGMFQEQLVGVEDGEFRHLVSGLTVPVSLNERWGIYEKAGEHPHVMMPLYQYVALKVRRMDNNNCGLVVGATYPEQLAAVRILAGDLPLLIPGIGKQAGDLESTVAAGGDSRGQGMIINSSRGILFASKGPDFDEAARAEVLKLNTGIGQFLKREVR